MKKILKPLIIAASVACVAGIGAVSYAAWTSNNSTTATGSATTGSITVMNGFFKDDSGNAKALALNTASTGKVLMPADQDSGALGTNGVTSLVYDIPEYQISGSYTLKLDVTAKKGTEAYTLPSGTKIQYKVNGSSWVDAGTAESKSVTGTDIAKETGKTLTIQLLSNDLNDMNLTLELTLTYADAT